jgi:hypothetical protein
VQIARRPVGGSNEDLLVANAVPRRGADRRLRPSAVVLRPRRPHRCRRGIDAQHSAHCCFGISVEDGAMIDHVMSAPTPEPHEFVVPPEMAEVAERLGLPWHVGDRVRFEVVEGEGGTGRPC